MSDGSENRQLTFTPNDIVGVIRQGLGELSNYLGQPLGAIDASVPVAYLERLHAFAFHLLEMQNAMMAKAQTDNVEAASARKN